MPHVTGNHDSPDSQEKLILAGAIMKGPDGKYKFLVNFNGESRKKENIPSCGEAIYGLSLFLRANAHSIETSLAIRSKEK